MGLNPLPQYKLYWHQNDFIGNSGVKKTMTCRRCQKLTQYLHVSHRANEPAQNSAHYDKMYKICPVFNMVQDRFAESYKPGKNQTIDKGMTTFKDRLSYVQYLPAKPIKRGIKVWMHCDAIQHICINLRCILVKSSFEFHLGYDAVMKLCKDISGKYHHVYCDNLFTSIQLLKDLLACKTHCNGTT